jgi:hypothetical protein
MTEKGFIPLARVLREQGDCPDFEYIPSGDHLRNCRCSDKCDWRGRYKAVHEPILHKDINLCTGILKQDKPEESQIPILNDATLGSRSSVDCPDFR